VGAAAGTAVAASAACHPTPPDDVDRITKVRRSVGPHCRQEPRQAVVRRNAGGPVAAAAPSGDVVGLRRRVVGRWGRITPFSARPPRTSLADRHGALRYSTGRARPTRAVRVHAIPWRWDGAEHIR